MNTEWIAMIYGDKCRHLSLVYWYIFCFSDFRRFPLPKCTFSIKNFLDFSKNPKFTKYNQIKSEVVKSKNKPHINHVHVILMLFRKKNVEIRPIFVDLINDEIHKKMMIF
eukprot:UN12631